MLLRPQVLCGGGGGESICNELGRSLLCRCCDETLKRERDVRYNRHCHFSLWEEMDIDKEDISSVTISPLVMLNSLWFF